MLSRKRRTWLVGAAVLVSVAACLIFAASRAVSGPYTFVSEFEGEQKVGVDYSGMTGGAPYDDGKLRYALHAPLSEVLPEMTRDLTADGWRLAYRDEKYAAFTRQLGKSMEIAELQLSYPATDTNHEAPPTECCVTLPPVQKPWFAERVEALLNHFRKGKPKGPADLFGFVSGFPDVEAKETSSNGKAVVRIKWSNRSPEPATGTVEYCCLRGYEPDQPVPLKTSLAPWQIKVIELTYPAAATIGEPRDPGEAVGGEYSFASSGVSGSGGFGGAGVVAPAIGTAEKGTHTVLTVENYNAWAVEIRGLVVKLNGVTKLKKPQPFALAPYKELRIPMPFYHAGKSPEPVVVGSYRLTRNRRWQAFDNRPQNGPPSGSELP